ncbi:hypothetical protein [Bdellovibrio bacteriovorus]|uniref:hypothetical protein n=1 Tax=Bdellovibrio bacteriovorus TaxID=959 RepID=UPI0035A74536
MKKFLGFLVIATLSLTAQADEYFVGGRDFYDTMEQYNQACDDVCEKPFFHTIVYSNGKSSGLLTKYDLDRLNKIMIHQSNIWADTILEGDYQSEGDTRLDEVVAIFKSSNLIGYKITYSEKAWDTASCDFDYEDESEDKYQDCTEGRIVESSFVSKDFKTYFRDDNAMAEFFD